MIHRACVGGRLFAPRAVVRGLSSATKINNKGGSSTNKKSIDRSAPHLSQTTLLPPFAAVVRYDNHIATIPFCGLKQDAMALHSTMTCHTPKQHVYVLDSWKESVPMGPYTSLDQIYDVLLQKEEKEEEKKE